MSSKKHEKSRGPPCEALYKANPKQQLETSSFARSVFVTCLLIAPMEAIGMTRYKQGIETKEMWVLVFERGGSDHHRWVVQAPEEQAVDAPRDDILYKISMPDSRSCEWASPLYLP